MEEKSDKILWKIQGKKEKKVDEKNENKRIIKNKIIASVFVLKKFKVDQSTLKGEECFYVDTRARWWSFHCENPMTTTNDLRNVIQKKKRNKSKLIGRIGGKYTDR